MGRMLTIALVLLSLAEAWLTYVVLDAVDVRPTVLQLVALAPILLAVNAVLLPLARRALRSERTGGPALARAWLIGSVAALLGGLLSILSAILLGGLAWAVAGASGEPAVAHRDWVLGGALSFGALGFAAIWWGYGVGQRWVNVEEVALPMRGDPSRLAHLRIAHVTDLHIGPLLRAPLLRKFVGRINAAGADVIVLTGDIFDFDPEFIEEGCRELGALSAPLGVYAVLGNHDVYTGADEVAKGIANGTGIRLLRDEWAVVGEGDEAFCLVGAEDPGVGWAKRDAELPALERLAREVPEALPRVLLIHRPSYFLQAARLGFPVVLTGHTHGGQLCPPFMRERNVSRLISRWTRGLYEVEGSAMYVNPGLGVAGLPVRLNCPREIALIRLVPADLQ
jgi:predicted MPP superfamily phosphohydrolase